MVVAIIGGAAWFSRKRHNLAAAVCMKHVFRRLPQLLCELTHRGRDKMDAISQTTCSSAFSWMKRFEFRLKFHWTLFPRVQLTIIQHCFRYWLGAVPAPSHYLNQWWLFHWRIYASLGLNELSLACMSYHRMLMEKSCNGTIHLDVEGVLRPQEDSTCSLVSLVSLSVNVGTLQKQQGCWTGPYFMICIDTIFKLVKFSSITT